MIKTDAINLCLRYIGEAPLPSGITIDSLDPQHEAVIIDTIIDDVSKREQMNGWWFNKESWTFTPDSSTNKINIPPTLLSFRSTAGDYIVRGGVLYDRTNKTYSFITAVEASVIWNIDFDTLPDIMAQYVAFVSAQEAQILFNGDSFVDKDLLTKVARTRIAVIKEHSNQSGFNLIKGSRIADRTMNPIGV